MIFLTSGVTRLIVALSQVTRHQSKDPNLCEWKFLLGITTLTRGQVTETAQRTANRSETSHLVSHIEYFIVNTSTHILNKIEALRR